MSSAYHQLIFEDCTMSTFRFPHFLWAADQTPDGYPEGEPHSADIATILSNPVIGGFAQPAWANFDGANDYISWSTPSPLADSNVFTIIARIRRDLLGVAHNVFEVNARFRFRISAGNLLVIVLRNASNQILLNTASSATIGTSTQVLMISGNVTGGSESIQVYLDDTDISPAAPVFSNTGPIDMTVNNTDIGADGTGPHANKFNGCIGPVWVSDNEAIDLSNAANRALIISAPGVITDPGADGSNWSPTSTAPEIYIADTLNAPGTNDGTAGNPVITAGTPYTACV